MSLAEAEAAIAASVFTPLADLAVEAWVTAEPVPYARRTEGRPLVLRPGARWSDHPFDCAWFRFRGTVPAEAAGHEIVLLIDVNGEALIVDGEGNPALGLTSASSPYSPELGASAKRVVPLVAAARGGEPVELWADAGANDLFGDRRGNGTLAAASIAIRHPAMAALAHDFALLHDLLQHLPADSGLAPGIGATLEAAAAVLHRFSEEEAETARALLAPLLARPAEDCSLTVSAIGHAHIDLAWLWPIRETIRKAARTFATQLKLLERYPAYVFGASQPQLYAWVKQHYPALYARIAAQVAAGRWEPQGAMWVEADLNVSGGEALVRQLLYGKRFFRDEFGADPQILWQPDVFGCNGQVPQLMAKSGVPFFMTQKLSWNWVTRFPHHTFWWQGIDGSKVLAHFPPEDTYNSSAAPRAVLAAARRFIDRGVSDRCLLLFGIGDGGGGPGEEHLERLARERDLGGLCPVVQEKAETFFRRIEAGSARYATHKGELYLERHQGTYTTQAQAKRLNRVLELGLRELEFAAAMAARLAGHPYPRARLEAIWQEALLYQFHDILPGSSIARVYAEALPRYAALAAEVARLTGEADAALCRALGGDALVLNSLAWPRRQWLKHDGRWIEAEVPAMGYAALPAAAPRFAPPAAAGRVLENEALRIEFAADGAIASILDKEADRPVLAPGAQGNVLAVYHDAGDAWDIPMDYRDRAPERFRLDGMTPLIDGPRAAFVLRFRHGTSTLEQEVALTVGSRRIDFLTRVEWRENGRMLRTSFPLAVAARDALCGIQFGAIARPTHAETPADAAKFEVCAHKWVDLSDGRHGAALLDAGKYGHALRGNVLDLNLLRSPHYPDPEADRGAHEFAYALLPHPGDHVTGGVVRAAYDFNIPLRVIGAGAGPRSPAASWLALDAPGIVIETVKAAEDGRGLIVRLYETAGAPCRASLRCGFPLTGALLTNLVEEDLRPLPLAGDALGLAFGPYEIHTVRLLR